jgi:hypothetical protein
MVQGLLEEGFRQARLGSEITEILKLVEGRRGMMCQEEHDE